MLFRVIEACSKYYIDGEGIVSVTEDFVSDCIDPDKITKDDMAQSIGIALMCFPPTAVFGGVVLAGSVVSEIYTEGKRCHDEKERRESERRSKKFFDADLDF